MPGFGITLTLSVAVLSLCTDAKLRRDEPVKVAEEKCKKLCKVDSGMDADARDCLTECASSTDLMTHDLDRGFEYFGKDESYNEKGGEKIKELVNEEAPEEIAECTPTVDLEKVPQFADLDTNGDGVIDYEESAVWSEKACVPDEMSEQVFSEADLNQDKVIDMDEFKAAGEGSKNEEAMDEALEKVSEGDDEYNSVQNPPLEEFDENNDGALDTAEAKEVFEHEVDRRTEHDPEATEETMKEIEPDVQEAIDKVDTNDDGEISGDEYVAKDEGSDLGEELNEAAKADEDKEEVDDLSRAEGAPPASFMQQDRRIRHRNSAFLHKRNRKFALEMHKLVRRNKNYALALQQLAQSKQWQREAQMLGSDAKKLHEEAAKSRQEAIIERRQADTRRHHAGTHHRQASIHNRQGGLNRRYRHQVH